MYLSLRFQCALACCLTLCAVPCLTAQSPTAQPAASPGDGSSEPMTQKQRLREYFRHMFNPEAVLRSAAGAGINQAMNTPSEWKQGGEGYGRRFESVYGEHLVQSTLLYALSDPLHEDNRYFRSGESGVGARLKYAVESAFLARHDDGSRHLSISALFSYAGTAAISRTWQPPSTRGAIHGVSAFGIAVAAEAGFNVAREFLPAIFRGHPPVSSR